MVEMSEIDAIKTIDHMLSQIDDPATRDRILRWAWEKFSSEPVQPKQDEEQEATKPTTKKKKIKAKKKPTTRAKAKSKIGPSIVKDLNLKPQNKQSFQSFIQTKKPQSDQEKCVVAVYYLRRELGVVGVGTDHVFTCFKDGKWRVPANLDNTLRVTASVKGWLNTSDMSKIELTTHGENLIEHDLPKKPKAGK